MHACIMRHTDEAEQRIPRFAVGRRRCFGPTLEKEPVILVQLG